VIDSPAAQFGQRAQAPLHALRSKDASTARPAVHLSFVGPLRHLLSPGRCLLRPTVPLPPNARFPSFIIQLLRNPCGHETAGPAPDLQNTSMGDLFRLTGSGSIRLASPNTLHRPYRNSRSIRILPPSAVIRSFRRPFPVRRRHEACRAAIGTADRPAGSALLGCPP